MLVISRKQNQKLLIGPDIIITVCMIGPKKVSLGVEAPRQVEVLREELHPSHQMQQSLKVAEGQQ